MRERPARRRGIADSESSASAASSTDSDADVEPPNKKKALTTTVCSSARYFVFMYDVYASIIVFNLFY